MSPQLYCVFVAETMAVCEKEGFTDVWKNNNDVFFTDNATRAAKKQERLSQLFPGKTVHIAVTSSIAVTKPGPISFCKVNEKGEVLPV